MRFAILSVLLLGAACLTGCGEKKPDPRERPDFVDTTDPSKVSLPKPGAPGPGGPPGANPPGQP
jgi:hypothetical protein